MCNLLQSMDCLSSWSMTCLFSDVWWISHNICVSPLFPFFRATLNWISYKFAQCGLVDCLISNMHLMESQICKKCTVYISYSMPIAQYTCCKITYQNLFSKSRTIFAEYSPILSHSVHHHHQLFHDIENVFAALTLIILTVASEDKLYWVYLCFT